MSLSEHSHGHATTTLNVSGMSCASCVARVEKALKAVPGVTDASVNLATERATVHAHGASVPDLQAAVAKIGYSAEPVHEHAAHQHAGHVHHDEAAGVLRRDTLIAAVLTIPLFVLEMGPHFFPAMHEWLMMSPVWPYLPYLFFGLATLVLFGPGLRFFTHGLRSLFHFAPEMNSLVALGAGAAWVYSTAVTFAPSLFPAQARNDYFESAAVIVTLILVGRWLEALAKGRTGAAVRHLAGLSAKTARVQRNGGTLDLPLEQVVVGDLVVVRPGEKIAVDGVVVEGSSFVDEAMLSGEAMPVAKALGAAVTGGTVNKSGSFTFRATAVGADTLLAQIIRTVEAAQGGKLPIQALVDRVTAWFVPAIMAVALATFGIWLVWGPDPALSFALVNAVAVLIIACPCAMGLATPTSIMVGIGRAAELGVLFRKSEALQLLRDVEVIAFDKTGTLTVGRPELTDFVAAPGFAERELLALAAAVESRSEHPLGEAIVRAAEQRGLPLPIAENFTARAGFGVSAVVDGRSVVIGSARLLAECGIASDAFAQQETALAEAGKSPLYLAVDERLAALLAVADPLKPTSRAAIAALQQQGVRVSMVSGDNRRTANAIARQLGITEVQAEVLPDGKATVVQQLQAGGKRVAFVGDGINDAPALATADIGIAVGSGTAVAIESADLVLAGADLRGVVDAVALSRAVMRNIAENLVWAFGYNVVLVPVAAGVLFPSFGILLSPVIAAGAMALSSVFVLGNALRLRGFRSPARQPTPSLQTQGVAA